MLIYRAQLRNTSNVLSPRVSDEQIRLIRQDKIIPFEPRHTYFSAFEHHAELAASKLSQIHSEE